MKIIIAGDFCENARVRNEIEKKNFGFLFDKIRCHINDSDLSVVNFEFPIVRLKGSPIKKNGPNLSGSINSIDAVKYAGFNCCTLANNHILDQGEYCCLDTDRLLNEAGISTVGVGANLKEASNILYKTIGLETIAIVNCCEHEFSVASQNKGGANPLNPLKQFYKIKEGRKNADYVIVIVHGGIEHFQYPSFRMIETYRFFIDSGADVVINHHQHCFSGYEIYNQKPIFYGLGNFLFDWNGKTNDNWHKGFLVELELKKGAISFSLHPYIQCLDNPSVELMNDEQRIQFEEDIKQINIVIKNETLLEEKIRELNKKTSNGYLELLEPYNNKYLKGLYRRGYLPSMISNVKRYKILNYIMCESHVERFINALNKK